MNHVTPGIEAIRADFPALRELTWLLAAGVGPMPAAVARAVHQMLERLRIRPVFEAWENLPHETCRSRLAELIGARPEEVALVRSTTEGLNALAPAIQWQRGDRIVITDQEYPANTVPWYHQAHRHGLEVKVVRSRDGRLPVDAFVEAVDDRTRLIAVSHVQFASGYRVDLTALSELARAHDALLVVDGIQSVGAIRVLVHDLRIDALACGGYKWLCGPIGTGFLYVRSDLAESLVPVALGFEQLGEEEYQADWEALCGSEDWVHDFATLAEAAKRFDGVGLSPPLFAGISAAADYILELGPGWIEERILGLSAHAIERARSEGYTVVTPDEPERRAGIVLFRGPWDLASAPARSALEKRLSAQGIVASVRGGGIRAACHFFNTEEDLDRLFVALASLSASDR